MSVPPSLNMSVITPDSLTSVGGRGRQRGASLRPVLVRKSALTLVAILALVRLRRACSGGLRATAGTPFGTS